MSEDKEKQRMAELKANRMLELLNALLQCSETDIDSQIKIIEMLNANLLQTPTFIAIIQSLKELRAIKKERIPCKHEWISSVAYKGAKICAKCDKIM